MKATLDIPDDLYRSVKARSALEGRPVRAVAIELFSNWIHSPTRANPPTPNVPNQKELKQFPWLAISHKHVKAGVSSDMDDIRESIGMGWAADSSEKLTSKSDKQ